MQAVKTAQTRQASTVDKYAAGSRSWRTNNPGLMGLGAIATQHGAIGQALGVAVFQNPQQGRNALSVTLADESFQSMTVAQVLKRFIPGYTPRMRFISHLRMSVE
jgi:phosphoglycerate dehydrogenase-like enzyme